MQREASTIPIVFVTVSDPVGSGFVASLPRPGGNITGFINVEASIAGKWLELLREIAPRTMRAGLMFNPSIGTYFDYYWKPFEAAATAAAVTPIPLPVRDIADIGRAFATRERNDGLVLMSDAFLAVNLTFINETALQFRVPVVSGLTQGGSMISYAPEAEDIFRRSASMWIRYFTVHRLPICRCSCQPNSNWRST
jgi:putative ABC transport system substrate-binding protein